MVGVAIPAAIYVRISDDTEGDRAGVKRQESDCRAVCERRGWPVAGIYEDNDPVNGRLMVIVNGNQDLQEYWEYSDRGYYPIDLSNEAYKLGVNYIVYGMTH